jgi:hypothetical protein
MPKPEAPKSGKAIAVGREHGLQASGKRLLKIDTAQCAGAEMRAFRIFCPFYHSPDLSVPVPGQKMAAQSVESIWQGLKIVDGQTDYSMFTRHPSKRPPEATRIGSDYVYSNSCFQYGSTVIDLLSARFLIYLPSYLYLLEQFASLELLSAIFESLKKGDTVLFYDWDSNHDICDVRTSFSHSAILAAWFNGKIEECFIRPAIGLGLLFPEVLSPTTRATYFARYQRYHEMDSARLLSLLESIRRKA